MSSVKEELVGRLIKVFVDEDAGAHVTEFSTCIVHSVTGPAVGEAHYYVYVICEQQICQLETHSP